jgi:2',3'-cyclic-nucleotide 2'-phosphodiesterase (5'-nucleotidase family)
VINLGREDLAYAKKLLARDGLDERIRSLPMIKNIISANAVFGLSAVQPAPYVIKEVSGPRIFGGKKKLRVGFVGLAMRNSPGGGVVAHCELEDALKLAGENLEADVVIAGDSGGIFNPRRVGSTLVVSAAPGNIREGDLRLYLDKDGKFSFKFRATDLDSVVPTDKETTAFVDAAREDRNRFK